MRLHKIAAIAGILYVTVASTITNAASAIIMSKPFDYHAVVQDVAASHHPARDLLGVHSLWWGHQETLMDGAGLTFPAVESWLRATGGVIRFGGGANEIPWEACGDHRENRKAFKAVPWAGPMVCRFGIDEYLQLTRKSGGTKAWLLANIAGEDQMPWSDEKMRAEAGKAARALVEMAPDLQRVWEIGNELDRGHRLWPTERLAARVSLAATAILAADPKAKLVLPMMDYDVPRQLKRIEYNKRFLESITIPVQSIAHHIYYDGLKGGPSIPTQLKPIVDSAALFRKLKGKPAEVWITEHGRWPDGDPSEPDWKTRWHQTNDLSGVISTADFLIAISQIEEVAGAMLHGLRAGPWNIFEKGPNGLQPTGVGRLLEMLAQTGATTRLKTTSEGVNRSGYRGGYDVRAAAFKTGRSGELVLWIVNRSPEPAKLFVALPAALLGSFDSGRSLICLQRDGRCTGDQFREIEMRETQLNAAAGGVSVSLPAAGVTVITLGRR